MLTLDATLAPQSTQLLQQLPPVNSSAVQAGFTVSVRLPCVIRTVTRIVSRTANAFQTL